MQEDFSDKNILTNTSKKDRSARGFGCPKAYYGEANVLLIIRVDEDVLNLLTML